MFWKDYVLFFLHITPLFFNFPIWEFLEVSEEHTSSYTDAERGVKFSIVN